MILHLGSFVGCLLFIFLNTCSFIPMFRRFAINSKTFEVLFTTKALKLIENNQVNSIGNGLYILGYMFSLFIISIVLFLVCLFYIKLILLITLIAILIKYRYSK